MKRRSLTRAFAATVTGLGMALVMLAPSAHAAPVGAQSTARSFQVNGQVTPITSPQAYAATPGAYFFDVSHMSLHISQPVYYVVTGRLSGGLYHYQYELVAAPRSYASEIEVAVNPITHTQLIEVGVPTAASLATIPTTLAASTRSATSSATAPSASRQLRALSRSTSGWYYTAWYDPANLVLTEVKDTINYTYDGYYINSFNGSDWRNWGWDGWGEVSHSIGSYYGSGYTSATVWTYDHFRNGVFCAFNATDVYYSDNNVVAHGNGGVGGYVNTWDSGGCSTWLHHSSTVGGGA